ncbi:MAG TPA: MDR family oxidoreductase [Steroidobacteraceae bacterium]|nr:MDR family oxidoreductase [Steroidobacteraceae bacterium]
MSKRFQAVFIEESAGAAVAAMKEIGLEDLPNRDVLVEVAFSSLNYKDGLALCGNRNKVARKLPLIGGIDLAGTVVESRSPDWHPGDKVIVNGWGMSEVHWGGFTRYQRVDPGWIVPQPDAFTAEQAMAIGTAGYTAALCVEALERWGSVSADGEVLVTGAAGGVGSVAIALLAARGYNVTASSGRSDTHAYLRRLGARNIIERESLAVKGAPLQKERWFGAVDSVGSTTLVNVLSQTAYGAAVAACGLAGGADLPGTVLPHILRGVALLGVDSVMAPMPKRKVAWARLARDLRPALLAEMTRVEPMSRLPQLGQEIVAGRVQGRVVIDVTR